MSDIVAPGFIPVNRSRYVNKNAEAYDPCYSAAICTCEPIYVSYDSIVYLPISYDLPTFPTFLRPSSVFLHFLPIFPAIPMVFHPFSPFSTLFPVFFGLFWCFSSHLPTVFLRSSYGFPTFLRASTVFLHFLPIFPAIPMVFHPFSPFSTLFPVFFRLFWCFSSHLPTVFLRSSYGIPTFPAV